MELREIETHIEELETRVDRLRGLYDQYFMGFEKLEPTVARKDVDRRIYVLRKENIRNTGLRFRFNILVQRYNTYQSYWVRICRQIEDGTYTRHVLRAKKRFGEVGVSQRPGAPLDRSTVPSERPVDFQLELAIADEAPTQTGTQRSPALAGAPVVRSKAPPSIPASAIVGSTKPRSLPVPTPPPRLVVPVTPEPLPTTLRGLGPQPSGALTQSEIPPELRGAVFSRPRPPPDDAPLSATQRSKLDPSALAAARAQRQTAKVELAAERTIPPAPKAPMTDTRVRELYQQYVDARQQAADKTPAVSFDKLKRTLESTESQLRERHRRAIDFRVEVVDGKAVVRPILK